MSNVQRASGTAKYHNKGGISIKNNSRKLQERLGSLELIFTDLDLRTDKIFKGFTSYIISVDIYYKGNK